MARLKPPYGTTAELTSAVMQERDLAYDTTLDRFTMGDGSAAAGKPLAFKSETDALTTLVAGLGGTAISAAWGDVINKATLALGLSAAGIGTEDTPTFTGLVLTGALAAASALDINPTANSTAMGLDIDQTGPISGGSLGTVFYFNDILVNSDQAQVTSTAYALAARYGFGGANLRGQRTALLGQAVLHTISGNTDESLRHYVGVSGEAQASVGDGGTDTGSGAQGSILGLYGSAILAAGATNLRGNIGLEVNNAVRATASVKDNIGIRICPWADHAVSGAVMDAAMQICAQSGAKEWTGYGIVFDTNSSGTEADLFGASATLIGSIGSDTLLNGVDISSFTFTGSAFKSNGFSVNGSGVVACASIELGHATANTLTASSGVLSVEGVQVAMRGASNTFTAEQVISYSQPALRLDETDAGTNQRYWYMYSASGVLTFAAATDAFSITTWLTVSKSAGVPSTAAFQVPVTATGALTANSGTAIPAGGANTLGVKATSTANFGVFFGSGAPTLSAAKGSLYLRSDGSTTNDRAYINSDGGTTWTALTTAA